MKNEALYHKTVGILVDAYFADTLVHNNCFACAVGNLICANMGYSYVACQDMPIKKIVWSINDGIYFNTLNLNGSWYDFINGWENKEDGNNKALLEIASTGYNRIEVYSIETAFEQAPKGNSDEDWIFNGLMAVVDALDKIHENTDTQVKEESKKRFQKVLCK